LSAPIYRQIFWSFGVDLPADWRTAEEGRSTLTSAG